MLFKSVTKRIIVALASTFVADSAIVQPGEKKKSDKGPTSTTYHYEPNLL